MPYGPAGSASAIPTPPTSCSTSPAWNRRPGSGRASCSRDPTSRGNRATTSPCRKARRHCGTATSSSSTPRAARGRATTARAAAHPDSDPLNPASWIKSGPVFTGNDRIHGVGHASFTTSPDGNEYWIYYHSKKIRYTTGGRDVRLQRSTSTPRATPLPEARRAGAPTRPRGHPYTRTDMSELDSFPGTPAHLHRHARDIGADSIFFALRVHDVPTATASRRRRWTKGAAYAVVDDRQPSPTSVWCWSATRSGVAGAGTRTPPPAGDPIAISGQQRTTTELVSLLAERSVYAARQPQPTTRRAAHAAPP